MDDQLRFCPSRGADPPTLRADAIAAWIGDLHARPNRFGLNVRHLDSRVGLSNATIQQFRGRRERRARDSSPCQWFRRCRLQQRLGSDSELAGHTGNRSETFATQLGDLVAIVYDPIGVLERPGSFAGGADRAGEYRSSCFRS